jgi:hypothetical protein
VCGLCPPGWAFIAKGCSECPPEDQLSPVRNAVTAIFVLVCLMTWYIVSWRPLIFTVDSTDDLDGAKKKVEGRVRKAENIKNKFENCIQTIPEKVAILRGRIFQVLGDDMQEQLEALTKDRIVQYLKLYITYFQVMSSFLTFSVKWPDLLRNCMLWIKGTLFLDVLQLPGLACLWTGIAFTQRLLTYTLGPLVVSFCLVMPCIFGWLAGYREKKKAQWEAASNAAWKNIMFWVFLVYPVVSLTTLQAFDCQPAGLDLLAADRNLKCPSGGDFLRGWSIAFIFVYPLGIPLFCWISMIGMGVHLIAQDKINFSILSSVVAKYMQVTTSIESHRIAGLFKSEDAGSPADPEVSRFWKSLKDPKQYLYENDLTNITFQGVDVNTIRKLVRDSAKDKHHDISLEFFTNLLNHEKRIGHIYNWFFDCNGKLKPVESCPTLSGVDFASMHRFVEKYDQDGDHLISLDEFRNMVKAVIRDTSLFTGVEGDRLTNDQAIALLTFDWKSIIPRPIKVRAINGPKKVETEKKARGKRSILQSVQADVESTLQTLDSAQESKDKIQANLDIAKTAKDTGQKAIKLGGSAAKHVSCCSREEGSDEDIVPFEGDDSEKGEKEGDHQERNDEDEENKDKEKKAKKNSNIWKDKEFLEVACKRYKDKVAAEIWKLGNTLLKNRVISIPDVVWSQSKSSNAMQQHDALCGESKDALLKDFVIHPDIDDDYRQQNYISKSLMLISLFSTRIPDSWKSVNKRKSALESKAMLRVGFVFSAYKVNFWYWEMIEMTRK